MEALIRDILGASTPLTRKALEGALYPLLPDLLTPEPALVDACLSSYGRRAAPGQWALREEDREPRRDVEWRRVLRNLILIGRELGLKVWLVPTLRDEGKAEGRLGHLLQEEEMRWNPLLPCAFDILWREGDKVTNAFLVTWHAQITALLLSEAEIGGSAEPYVVLPERRAPLTRFKLQRIPPPEDWRWSFVQWEALERLMERGAMTWEDWRSAAGLEAIRERGKDHPRLFES